MHPVPAGGRRLTHAAIAARHHTIEPAPASKPISRKELAIAARDAMKALDLRPALRLVLAELVGCYGEIPLKDRIIVWPSNAFLVARTGLSERAVRYGIRGLTDLELIATKDSANGKRFAVKSSAGVLIDAFGFDLAPLYARRHEWTERIAAKKRFSEMARRSFDEITIYRRASEEALAALATHYPAIDRSEIEHRLSEAKRVTPRRSAAVPAGMLEELVGIYRMIRELAETAFYQAGCGGKECRHIENNNESPVKSQDTSGHRRIEAKEIPSTPRPLPSLALILEACPTLSLYSRPIMTEADLISAAKYLRPTLGAHESAWVEATERLGALRASVTLAVALQLYDDDINEGRERIKNPGGYFRTLARLVCAGKFDLEVEILTLRRRHLS